MLVEKALMEKVTVLLPKYVCQSLKRRAAENDRNLDDQLREELSELPKSESVEFMRKITRQDDERLWVSARRTVPKKVAQRLARLNLLAKERKLTAAEHAEQLQHCRVCDEVMLTRAAAMGELKRRGYDISSLGPKS